MAQDSYRHAVHEGSQGAPLLFAFHGTGGNEAEMIGLGAEVAPRATVIAPRGDVSEGGALRFFRRTAEGVYDMADLAARTATMAAFVRLHAEARGAGSVSGIGYSNGANILASVLFAAPDIFDRVALLHPLIPFEPEVQGTLVGKRVLITAGRRDPICPPHLTARLEAHLRGLGAELDMQWHEGGHELRAGELVAARQLFRSGDND